MLTLTELMNRSSAALLFECLAGSRAYGTATAASDEDIRGIFAVPAVDYLQLESPANQLADERGNVVYYSLRRVIELLAQANPNILELLYMPRDCVRLATPEMQMLQTQRQLFISKQCADTHAGYAMSQIKRARGQNKWVNNPKPQEPLSKEDFCHVIPWHAGQAPPARPVPLRSSGWSLTEYHAAKLEHVRDVYRLYHYGTAARGVFRGDVLVCESIPRDEEMPRFAGLLVYNESAWKQALADHHNYWTWRRERNDARWQQQERGAVDFDAKNVMHTVRLLLSVRSILANGEPIGSPMQRKRGLPSCCNRRRKQPKPSRCSWRPARSQRYVPSWISTRFQPAAFRHLRQRTCKRSMQCCKPGWAIPSSSAPAAPRFSSAKHCS